MENHPNYFQKRKIYKMLAKTRRWQKQFNILSYKDINREIKSSNFKKLVDISETHYEDQIQQIIHDIKKRKSIRLILIAGPSSSGKTTFSYRLKDSLKNQGIESHSLSLDNYFKNREETPKDKNGEYDFESIDALDLTLLNSHLKKLFSGEKVQLPTFDFVSGEKKFNNNFLQLNSTDILIVEGIHGLNKKMTLDIQNSIKYKVYVTAMLQLKDPFNKFFHTTDNRFIRRIVRDMQFRGYNASETIKRWPSVVRGEQKNIFKFQHTADFVFNSSLLYEMPVLKLFAFDLLVEINKNKDVFWDARRLLTILNYFDFVSESDLKFIPKNSAIREFIGKSQYKY